MWFSLRMLAPARGGGCKSGAVAGTEQHFLLLLLLLLGLGVLLGGGSDGLANGLVASDGGRGDDRAVHWGQAAVGAGGGRRGWRRRGHASGLWLLLLGHCKTGGRTPCCQQGLHPALLRLLVFEQRYQLRGGVLAVDTARLDA